MSENVNRKACDSCHSQKLSCKRVGDGVCDRCLRLNAECKSSPSLRYKRQLQQQDQMQEQKPQQQSQQPEQSQLSYHCHQDQQQQRQPRPNYQQGQIATCQRALNFETQPHTEAQDSAEGRSPKRRRTGSEVHPVQRDAGLPLVATDATLNPGLQGHLITAPDGSAGLAEYAINLRNMNCIAISQPPIPPAHLLGSQVPSGVDDYFSLHQVIPSLWPHQSSPEEAQQPRQHPHLVPQHDHEQQQPIFDTVSAAPLVVPISAAAQQQQVFSSHYYHPQLHPTHKAAPILGSRRRQAAVPTLTYSILSALPATERRSRSNKVQIRYTDLVTPNSNNLSEPRTMHQFSVIWSRLRVLADHLDMVEAGKDYGDGPDGKPNEFTVAELYKHTHVVADALEQAVAIRNRSGGGSGSSSSSGARTPIITAGDLADGMFTMALYAQILHLMQLLFTHVRKVLAAADPHRDDTFAAWLLPEMNIGAALIDAHPTFHMSLTVQLATQFLGRLREAVTILCLSDIGPAGANFNGTAAAATGAGPHAEMIGIPARFTFVSLKIQEGELGKTLGQLQEELRKFMDTMDAIDAMEEDEKKKH